MERQIVEHGALGQIWRIWSPSTLLVGVLSGVATAGKSVVVSQKSKYGITVDSSNSTYVTTRVKSRDVDRSLHTMLTSVLTTAEGTNHPHSHQWINRLSTYGLYLWMGCYWSSRRVGLLTSATAWCFMSQKARDRQIFMIKLTWDTEHIRHTSRK